MILPLSLGNIILPCMTVALIYVIGGIQLNITMHGCLWYIISQMLAIFTGSVRMASRSMPSVGHGGAGVVSCPDPTPKRGKGSGEFGSFPYQIGFHKSQEIMQKYTLIVITQY